MVLNFSRETVSAYSAHQIRHVLGLETNRELGSVLVAGDKCVSDGLYTVLQVEATELDIVVLQGGIRVQAQAHRYAITVFVAAHALVLLISLEMVSPRISR